MNGWNRIHRRFRRAGWHFGGGGWKSGTSTTFCADGGSTQDGRLVSPRCVYRLLLNGTGVPLQGSAWGGRQDGGLKIGFNDDQTSG